MILAARLGDSSLCIDEGVDHDGQVIVCDGERDILTTPAPLDAVQLRALGHAWVELDAVPLSAATATKPAADHPWRR